MSEFKTGFFARMNELADNNKNNPIKYYIMGTFDNSDKYGIRDCIFTATSLYELWLKVHYYILSKYPTSNSMYNEDYFIELGHDEIKENEDNETEEETIDITKLINASIKGLINDLKYDDTQWFKEYTKLI